MSCLRTYAKIRQKHRESGNAGTLFLLLSLGSLLLAGHAMLTQIGNFHGSLKNFFNSLLKRQTMKNLGRSVTQGAKDVIADDAAQQTLDGVGDAVDINDDRARARDRDIDR